MKNKLMILIAGLFMFSGNAISKNKSGIYMNPNDFKAGKLAYESDCPGKIKLHDFFGSTPYVTVANNGMKHKYKKSELFGYKDCSGITYRFYKNDVYQIAEAGPIFIYIQEQSVTKTKGFEVVKTYYFSAAADGEIQPLTKANLKHKFSANSQFADMLDQYFNGSDISAYDNEHKTFKVNYVFGKTQNNK